MHILVSCVFYSTALQLEDFKTEFPKSRNGKCNLELKSRVEISHMT
jgi:hypothetical protein